MPNINELIENLPSELLPYKDSILASVKPVIDITLSPADDLSLWASKVGGKPYLPLDIEYPCNEKGEPLGFLAQFNCKELPKTDELPEEGILSFFIDMDSFESKVFYFEKIIEDNNQLWQNFDQLDKETLKYKLPFYMNPKLTVNFELNQKPVASSDFQFNELLFKSLSSEAQVPEGCNNVIYDSELFDGTGHHLLGYPYFTQGDPRFNSFYQTIYPEDEFFDYEDMSWEYILLFQLDTQDFGNKGIMWGDTGVGNFFIHPNDLKNRDFSKVVFYWDCM